LLAAEPYLEFSYYGRNAGWGQSNDESNMDSTDTDLDTGMGTQPRLDPPQLARMEQLAAAAYERRHDTVNATRMLAAAIDSISDKAQKTALREQQKRIDLEQRRDAENDARMPSVHPAVEQDRIVRPRLLPGMPVPAETAEEEQE
jgi:hypothetical protein